MKKTISTYLALLAVLLSPLAANAGPIVANGGFESGLSDWTRSGNFTCTGVGSSAANVNPLCIGIDNDPLAHSGASALYMGTPSGEVFSQSLTTVAGTTYQIDFWLAVGAWQGSSTPNSFQVEFGSTSLSLANAAEQGWTEYSFMSVATGSSTLLSFSHSMTPSWFVLDDVSVTAVPEPGTLALFGLGLFGMGLARRKKV